VKYECLLDALPTYSCGVAGAFSRVADFEHAMYFNTCNPHSDDEIRNYFEAPFRRYIGKRGIIECVIDPLQVRAGEYYVSVGILPNTPSSHEFYEQHYLAYKVSVLEQGFDEPAVFYPIVKWIHLPVDNSMENERRDLI